MPPAIALLVVVSVGTVSLIAVSMSRASLRQQALAASLTAATLAARAVEQHMGGALSIMREAAARPKLNLEIRSGNWAEAARVLQNVVRHFPQFSEVLIQDPEGVTRARVSDGPSNDKEAPVPDFFQHVVRTRGPYVTDVYVSSATKQPAVSTAMAVLDPQERVVGVLVGVLSLQTMSDVLSAFTRQDDGGIHLAVVNRKGIVIARSTGAGDGWRQAIDALPDAATMLTGEAATVAAVMELTPNGRREALLGAHAPIAPFGWAVVATKSAAVALAPVDQLRVWLLGAAASCAALAVVLGWRLARALTGPLSRLVSATDRLAAGDFNVRVSSNGGGEVAALGASFNRMAEQLQATTAARRRTEETLERYAERLRILHDIDRSIIGVVAPEEMAAAVVRSVRELLGVPRAIVNLLDLDAGEVEWLAAAGRHRIRRGPGVRYSIRLMGDLDALQRGEPQVVDVRDLQPSPEADALLASGVHEYMVVPMIAAGELIGSLSFGGAPGPFPPEQVSIAQEIAAQLAIAIAQARLYEQVKGQAAELEQRVLERTSQLHIANVQLGQEVAERRRAESEAASANRAKSEFLSRMSHELRTPLNGVIGFAQLLELDRLGPDQQESVTHILRGGRHLLALINEVLDISRVEAGRLSMSLEPVVVAEVLAAALDLIRPQAAARDIDVPPEVLADLCVMADRQRLQQVLLNLLSNAVKYNRTGGTIRVSLEETATGLVRVHVTDTGKGIPPEKMARLFTPFDRLDAEHTGIEGTGLGLTLAKHLTEAMGGGLWAESTVDEGTTFTLELPRAERPGALGAAEEGPQVSRRADVHATVLYVEDNLANLRLLERILGLRPGVTLISAMQGRRGVELARGHRPDLILLDLHLPDVAGDEVLSQLREDPRTRDIPVLMLSADTTPGQIKRLLELGASAYLTKPLDVKQTLAVLDEWISAAAR